MLSTEVTSSLVILTTCALIIRGLLSYMATAARTTNTEYMALRKQYEKKDTELLEAKSDRDLWKMKAMKYSDERNNAIKYAKHWREQARQIDSKPSPTLPAAVSPISISTEQTTTTTTRADVSGVMKFELEQMESEIEAEID